MEKFIIVAGAHNSGKTISTNLAINGLIDKGYNVLNYFQDNSKKNFWMLTDAQGNPYKKAGSVVLEKDGKRIAVISYGDTENSLSNIFSQINFENYYAIVCCARSTKGKSVFNFFHKIIQELDLNNTQVIPICKNFLSNHNNDMQENEQVAKFIVSLL